MRKHVALLSLPLVALSIGIACSTSSSGDGASDGGGDTPDPTTTATGTATAPTSTATTVPAIDASPPGTDGGADSGADSGADGGLAACNGKRLLLLADGEESTVTAGQALFEGAKFAVTTVPNYEAITEGFVADAGDAGEPGTLLSKFAVVVVLPGTNYPAMTDNLQKAVLAAHDAGVGLVFEEWSSYNAYAGTFSSLQPLMLFEYQDYTTEFLTLKASGTHPIWEGLPATFTTVAKTSLGYDDRDAGTDAGINVVARADVGDAGTLVGLPNVFAFEGKGRIAQTGIATNYAGENALANDVNVKMLYVNMAKWAARCH